MCGTHSAARTLQELVLMPLLAAAAAAGGRAWRKDLCSTAFERTPFGVTVCKAFWFAAALSSFVPSLKKSLWLITAMSVS